MTSAPGTPAAPGASAPGAATRRAPSGGRLAGRRICLAVTGSVAAYKAVVLLRLLHKEGAEIEVVLSRAAREFVGAASFAGLNAKPPWTDMFEPGSGGEPHVDLGARSDLILIAPATADALARLAQGRADDLVSALALAARCPLLVAPAMHPSMWAHPATQRNAAALLADGRASLVGPVHGEVASGEVGIGRMAEPEVLLEAAIARLAAGPLGGRHVVVSAGPTSEALDAVRTLSNRSSGRMGFALAERAAQRGARVTLVSGRVALGTPPGVQRVDVESTLAMRDALWQALGSDLSGADALIMAAAVADYRPLSPQAGKIARGQQPLSIELVPNPDLLAEIGAARRGKLPVLVGFALETEHGEPLLARAADKLASKRVDLIVANHADESLERDDVRAVLVGAHGSVPLPTQPKRDAADRILDWLGVELAERAG